MPTPQGCMLHLGSRFRTAQTLSRSIMERYSFEGCEAVQFPISGECDWCRSDKAKEGGEKLKKCSGCSVVLYCSRQCQMAAWPKHK